MRQGWRSGRASIFSGVDAGEELDIRWPFVNHGFLDVAFVDAPLVKNVGVDAGVDEMLEGGRGGRGERRALGDCSGAKGLLCPGGPCSILPGRRRYGGVLVNLPTPLCPPQCATGWGWISSRASVLSTPPTSGTLLAAPRSLAAWPSCPRPSLGKHCTPHPSGNHRGPPTAPLTSPPLPTSYLPQGPKHQHSTPGPPTAIGL